MNTYAFSFGLLLLLLIPFSYTQADPTEIQITVAYKLTTTPAEIEVTASHTEQVSDSAERKEVEVVRSGGLAGALGGVTTAIDTAGYTKVNTIVRNGKTYDIYEQSGSSSAQLQGTTTIKVHSTPTSEGIQLHAGSITVHITTEGDAPGNTLNDKKQQLRVDLERLGAQIIDQLNRAVPFSQSDIDSLFSYQPTPITKTITYRVKGEQRELSITVNSEASRIIDAPLGEDV